jgi:hypothetical protein
LVAVIARESGRFSIPEKSVLIEKLPRTGYPAFAGYDDLRWKALGTFPVVLACGRPFG